MVDEELREIIIERDDIDEQRFEHLIKTCEILDIAKYHHPKEFERLVAHKLAEKIETDEEKLYRLIKDREKDSNMMIHPGIAIFSHIIKGRDKFEILFVRSKKGIILSDDVGPIHAFFVIVASPDQKNFYLHSLMWVVQIAEETDFETEWIIAKDDEELKDIILAAWKKRESI